MCVLNIDFLLFIILITLNSFFCYSINEKKIEERRTDDIRLGDVKCTPFPNYFAKTSFRLSNGDLFFFMEHREKHDVILVKLMAPKEGKLYRLYDGYPKTERNWKRMFDWSREPPSSITAAALFNDRDLYIFFDDKFQHTKRIGTTDDFSNKKQIIRINEMYRGWLFERLISKAPYLSVSPLRHMDDIFVYFLYRPNVTTSKFNTLKSKSFLNDKSQITVLLAFYDLRAVLRDDQQLRNVDYKLTDSTKEFADFVFQKLSNSEYFAYKRLYDIEAENILSPITLIANEKIKYNYMLYLKVYYSREETITITFNSEFSKRKQEYNLFLPETYLMGCPIDKYCLRFFIDDATLLTSNKLLIFQGRHVIETDSLFKKLSEPRTIPEYFRIDYLPFYIDAAHTDPRTGFTYIIRESHVWVIKQYSEGNWDVQRPMMSSELLFRDLKMVDASLYTQKEETFFFIGEEASVWQYDVSKFPMVDNIVYKKSAKWISDLIASLPSTIDASFRSPDDHQDLYVTKNNYFYLIKQNNFWEEKIHHKIIFLGNFFKCSTIVNKTRWNSLFFYNYYYKNLTPTPSNHSGISTSPSPPYSTPKPVKTTSQTKTIYSKRKTQTYKTTKDGVVIITTEKSNLTYVTIAIVVFLFFVAILTLISCTVIYYATKDKTKDATLKKASRLERKQKMPHYRNSSYETANENRKKNRKRTY